MDAKGDLTKVENVRQPWLEKDFSTDKYSARYLGYTKDTAKQINERYRNWKRNAVFVTDYYATNVSPHPSRTVDLLAGVKLVEEEVEDVDRNTYTLKSRVTRALIGSLGPLPQFKAASENEILHSLFLVDIRVPVEHGEKFDKNKPARHGLNIGGVHAHSKIEMSQYIPVGDEISRARFLPQLSNIIAARTLNNPDVLLFDMLNDQVCFDYELYSNELKQKAKPFRVLKGFEKPGGHALAFNSKLPGYLLAASSEDKSVCVWSIKDGQYEMQPLRKYNTDHKAAVQDAAWSSVFSSTFASVDDEGIICVTDIRQSKPSSRVRAHYVPINCISFANQNNSYTFATGCVDGTIGLWDLRHMGLRIHSIEGVHTQDVVQIAFSPNNPLMFASAGYDAKLFVYDLACVGAESGLNNPDEDNLPPEVFLQYSGHSAGVNDFAWSKTYPRMVVSVSDDNCIQAWEMSQRLYEANENRRKWGPLYSENQGDGVSQAKFDVSKDHIRVPPLPGVECEIQREFVLHDDQERFKFAFEGSEEADSSRPNTPVV